MNLLGKFHRRNNYGRPDLVTASQSSRSFPSLVVGCRCSLSFFYSPLRTSPTHPPAPWQLLCVMFVFRLRKGLDCKCGKKLRPQIVFPIPLWLLIRSSYLTVRWIKKLDRPHLDFSQFLSFFLFFFLVSLCQHLHHLQIINNIFPSQFYF